MVHQIVPSLGVVPTSADWLVFLGAAALFAVIPGPGILYVRARSLRGGRGDGIRSTIGIGIGALGHVAAAAVGPSAPRVALAGGGVMIANSGSLPAKIAGREPETEILAE